MRKNGIEIESDMKMNVLIDIKKKLILMGFLLVVSLAFLYIYETLPGLIAALVIGAISLLVSGFAFPVGSARFRTGNLSTL